MELPMQERTCVDCGEIVRTVYGARRCKKCMDKMCGAFIAQIKQARDTPNAIIHEMRGGGPACLRGTRNQYALPPDHGLTVYPDEVTCPACKALPTREEEGLERVALRATN